MQQDGIALGLTFDDIYKENIESQSPSFSYDNITRSSFFNSSNTVPTSIAMSDFDIDESAAASMDAGGMDPAFIKKKSWFDQMEGILYSTYNWSILDYIYLSFQLFTFSLYFKFDFLVIF